MRLSPHEQQILDEIQRCVQAEDPTFFASMAGSQVRRRSVWGSVTFLLGLAAFLFGAVMAQALPGVGVGVSVAGFLAMFCGIWLLCSGDRAFHPHEQHGAAVWRRFVEFWADMDGPPSTGLSG